MHAMALIAASASVVTMRYIGCDTAGRETYRHSHFSNTVDHDDQQSKEGEPSNFLAIIRADRVHMGPQK